MLNELRRRRDNSGLRLDFSKLGLEVSRAPIRICGRTPTTWQFFGWRPGMINVLQSLGQSCVMSYSAKLANILPNILVGEQHVYNYLSLEVLNIKCFFVALIYTIYS